MFNVAECYLTPGSLSTCFFPQYSRDILQALTDTDLSDDNFPFSTHQIITLAGHKLRALRLTFVGELGWELHVPNESAVPVYRAVMQEGAHHGIVNAGYRAIESLSIEKGRCLLY